MAKIVKVRYFSETTGELSPREYTYYSVDGLKVGDLVTVPWRDTTAKAMVSAVDVAEAEIADFRDKVKTIPAGSVPDELTETENRIEKALDNADKVLAGGAEVNSPDNIAKRIKEASQKVEARNSSLRQPSPLKNVPTIATSGSELPIEIPETAVVKVKPEADIEIQSFYAEALKLRKYAETRAIVTAEDLKPATADLSIIAKVKKGLEEKRKEYLQPLEEHKKAINDAFKTLMEPIEQADRIIRDKILAFGKDQEGKRREAERINALRIEAARAEMSLKGELSESVNLVEVVPEAPHRIVTDMGTAGQRDNWKWEVADINLVPREYLMPNVGMLTPIVKASKGKIVIPGIKIYNEPILAVNTR